jgi:hypothetical protein
MGLVVFAGPLAPQKQLTASALSVKRLGHPSGRFALEQDRGVPHTPQPVLDAVKNCDCGVVKFISAV